MLGDELRKQVQEFHARNPEEQYQREKKTIINLAFVEAKMGKYNCLFKLWDTDYLSKNLESLERLKRELIHERVDVQILKTGFLELKWG